MDNEVPIICSLPELAAILNLPKAWLRAEADAGRLPHFKIGYRYRFDPRAVQEVLAARARNQRREYHV